MTGTFGRYPSVPSNGPAIRSLSRVHDANGGAAEGAIGHRHGIWSEPRGETDG